MLQSNKLISNYREPAPFDWGELVVAKARNTQINQRRWGRAGRGGQCWGFAPARWGGVRAPRHREGTWERERSGIGWAGGRGAAASRGCCRQPPAGVGVAGSPLQPGPFAAPTWGGHGAGEPSPALGTPPWGRHPRPPVEATPKPSPPRLSPGQGTHSQPAGRAAAAWPGEAGHPRLGAGGGGGGRSHPIALEGIHRVPPCTGLGRGWAEAAGPFVRGGGGWRGAPGWGCSRWYLRGPLPRRRMQACLAEFAAGATLG